MFVLRKHGTNYTMSTKNSVKHVDTHSLPEFKPCPGCGVYTDKVNGCNLMKCTMCNCKWCWVCNRKKPKQQRLPFTLSILEENPNRLCSDPTHNSHHK